ncbi:MAG TPA: OmpH family outer membrane protein [Bryobacteraceae bacterium]|jgi:outer membrane protein|nr:OmpH family outer membrane protein [Bryobacteraceae bacterium]
MFRISLLMLASAFVAMAQAKVGVINVQNAILETAEIKKAQADLTAKYKPRQTQVEALQKELQDLQTKLQSGKLTDAAAQDAQITGQRRQRELQRLVDDLQADVDRERNDILQRSGQRMTDVVKKLAEAKGLDMVVDVSTTLYYKPAMDFTKEAVAEYDKAYPAK